VIVAAVFLVWSEPCLLVKTLERNAPSADSWNS
jgi:hypothetical protein